MREQQFRAWLKKTGAERNRQVIDARHLDGDYRNLDDHLPAILKDLQYSKDDANASREKPDWFKYTSKQAPHTPAYYKALRKNLSNYVSVAKLYGRFLKEAESEPPTVPADQAELDASVGRNDQHARERIQQSIVARRGQQAFRNKLGKAYNDRCAFSDSPVLHVLEAAHITPYLGLHTNRVTNGILLRADIHTLFNCRLMGVKGDTFAIHVSAKIRKTDFGKLHGKSMILPSSPHDRPDRTALEEHLQEVMAGEAS